jgi:branched-chain amino acid transport system substrate-binding protein
MLWRETNFAIVDDGTIHARDLVESFRQAALEAGLKPVFSDTFRPGLEKQNALANRLRKAGATHVLFGGSIDDAIILSRDAQEYGGLTLALGESALPLEPQTAHGPILALALPDFTLMAESAAAKLAIEAEGILPDAYALLAYAAVEIAAASGQPGPFTTAAGTIAFTPGGDLADNPFRLTELKNGAYVPLPANAEGQ